jgi:hypothetical protein
VTGTRDQKQLKCDENDERILWPARGLYAKEKNTETTKREIVKGGEENVWRGICGYLFTPADPKQPRHIIFTFTQIITSSNSTNGK